jgi:hypothetical protein
MAKTTAELLAEIRYLYAEVADTTDKDALLATLAEQLPAETEPLRLAYRAVGEALKARHTWLPWEKLAYYKTAMQMFEQALAYQPTEIEVRFLRYTIQQNTPSLLGLGIDIEDDKRAIVAHILSAHTDHYMKKSIAQHLLEHERLAYQDRAVLAQIVSVV